MKDYDEYRLWIDAYSPETIPMERLAEYLSAFAKLLGNKDSVHFSGLAAGSTAAVARVEREAAPKVADRVARADRPDAANDERAAFEEINELARSDNATAKLFKIQAVDDSDLVLVFPGRDTPPRSKFGPFNEPAEIVGELVRVGGRDASAHAMLLDAEGRSWSGVVKKDVAQRMATHLYKVLRVQGTARWERGEDGSWRLISLRIDGFEALSDGNLSDAVKRLRTLRDSDWSKSADIDGMFRAARGYDDELH